MTKTKKIAISVISILSLLIFSLVGLIYVHYNLLTYQIYYAKQMPHAKGTNPEMVLLLDRLDYLGDSPVEGIRYDTDGYNVIIKDDNSALRRTNDSEKAKYEYSIYQNYFTYYFDIKGKFVSFSYPKNGKILYEDTDTRKHEAQAYIDEVMDPIVDKTYKKPSINLQWFFNWKYEKRFSGD